MKAASRQPPALATCIFMTARETRGDQALSLTLESAAATEALGRRLGQAARAGDVFLIEGELGAGKTVLVRGLAAGLDISDTVTSPTFVLVHQHHGRLPLVHADLYRLETQAEVAGLGLLELAADGVLAVEWPARGDWSGVSSCTALSITPGAREEERILTLTSESSHLRAVLAS